MKDQQTTKGNQGSTKLGPSKTKLGQEDAPSIYSVEHALHESITQAISMIDAAKRDGDPKGELLPALRRLLRGAIIAAAALNGDDEDGANVR